MTELKPCPFGADHKVWIGVHDDEGNYHGAIGCEYESDPWSGITYALHHSGWGDCPLCTCGEGDCMGGMLFDTQEDATEAWNTRFERTCAVTGVEYDKTMGARFALSCGHSTWHDGDGNAPGYCQDCGRMIMA